MIFERPSIHSLSTPHSMSFRTVLCSKVDLNSLRSFESTASPPVVETNVVAVSLLGC